MGMTDCAECAAGSYASHIGTTACRPCRPGLFNAAPMSVRCDPCRLGTFVSTTGASACEPCSLGKYNDKLGLNSSCSSCPLARFTSGVGTSECQRCPDARMTTMTKIFGDGGQQQWAYRDGAEDESWCGCDKLTRLTNAGNCVDCEEGVDCVGMGEFFIKSGYAAE